MRLSLTKFALASCFFAFFANASAAEICPMKIIVRKDGAIVVDGKAYSDGKALKARFRAVMMQHSGCAVSFATDKDTPYEAVARALAIFQELGVTKIGFLTEPQNVPKSQNH